MAYERVKPTYILYTLNVSDITSNNRIGSGFVIIVSPVILHVQCVGVHMFISVLDFTCLGQLAQKFTLIIYTDGILVCLFTVPFKKRNYRCASLNDGDTL